MEKYGMKNGCEHHDFYTGTTATCPRTTAARPQHDTGTTRRVPGMAQGNCTARKSIITLLFQGIV